MLQNTLIHLSKKILEKASLFTTLVFKCHKYLIIFHCQCGVARFSAVRTGAAHYARLHSSFVEHKADTSLASMASTVLFSSFLQPSYPPIQLPLRRPRPSAAAVAASSSSGPRFIWASSKRSWRCASSVNGGPPTPGRGDEDQGVKEVERMLEDKRRAELAARIASGEFTVRRSG